jgi:hypothetical protein
MPGILQCIFRLIPATDYDASRPPILGNPAASQANLGGGLGGDCGAEPFNGALVSPGVQSRRPWPGGFLLNGIFQLFSRLKFYHLGGRNLDGAAGLRISPSRALRSVTMKVPKPASANRPWDLSAAETILIKLLMAFSASIFLT